ncbi:MAG TPA: serine/threonine-protein kinase [Polyangiaceae bacterium]
MSQLGAAAGTVIAGRYSLGARIGTGGMGAVYEGTHIVTRRPCAIKLMLGHTAEREEMRTRFFRESRALAQIKSEYIVDVLDAGIDPDTHVPFLVMERLTGIDLGELVGERGALPANDVLLYLWHAALALDRTHRASIVHRDLKASNLFLTQREDGSPLVKVLDFGVAKMMRLDATSEGGTQAVGTPLYMAPEQFRGKGRVSPATDIYALGMLAYLLLVGKHYWREEREACENPFAFASLAAKGPVEPASARAARCTVLLTPAFDAWFARATAYRTDERFASAVAAITDLSRVFGLAAPSPPPSLSLAPAPGRTLSRSHDSRTENLGPRPLQDTSGVISAALSFTDSQLVQEDLTAPPGESTEMPLSVTNGGLAASSPRRWPWIAVAALLASSVAFASGWYIWTGPPPPLERGFAHSPNVAGVIHAPTPILDPPVTPADLALAPGEPAEPERHGRTATRAARARAAAKATARRRTAAPAVEAEPLRVPPSPPGDRSTLYRRD